MDMLKQDVKAVCKNLELWVNVGTGNWELQEINFHKYLNKTFVNLRN